MRTCAVLVFSFSFVFYIFSHSSGALRGEKSRQKCQAYHNISDEAMWNNDKQFAKKSTDAPNKISFVVALGYELEGIKKYLCSGAIVSEQFVITAAHCISHEIWGEVKYIRLNDFSKGHNLKEFIPKRYYMHPNYTFPSRYHDIALIELHGSVSFTDTFVPACIDINQTFHDQFVYGSRWKNIDNSEEFGKNSQISQFHYCNQYYCGLIHEIEPSFPGGILYDSQICAGAIDHVTDDCEADAGGPLVYRNFPVQNTTKVFYLNGVVSFSKTCAFGKLPAVYTRIRNYVDWIESIVWSEDFLRRTNGDIVFPEEYELISYLKWLTPAYISLQKCLLYNNIVIKPGEKMPIKGMLGTGGVSAIPKQMPYMAALAYEKGETRKYLCGGSLISENFILTAAHCVFSKTWGKVKYVRLGDLNLYRTNDDAFVQEFQVKQYYLHPEFQYPAKYHDVALLQLDGRIFITNYVTPACLDYRSASERPPILLASGWGRLGYGKPLSAHLQVLPLASVSFEKCLRSYTKESSLPIGLIDSQQLCAESANWHLQSDTCEGDSGGPLAYHLDILSRRVNYVVGITSFGKPCGLATLPGVYARVAYYIEWIEKMVWPE